MTAAVYRSGTSSLSVPETQNTAPVLEFNCMYTHDVRRKQKRWQDGFLRFHTFNKRIMVYDVPRNFIGDVHWKAEGVLQDGDEVTLERDGILVQVAESLGSTETDLTELRRSKKKTSSEVGSSSPVRAAAGPAMSAPKRTTSKPITQLKHRSLNALLGTLKGPIGKAALPLKSPFEERHVNNENEDWSTDRPAKRIRLDQQPSWNVTRTTTTSNPAPLQKPILRNGNAATVKSKRAPLGGGQQRLGIKEIIDLSVEDNESEKFMAGFSSEALAPSSSPQKQHSPAKKVAAVRSSSPAFQTQNAPVRVVERTQKRLPARMTEGATESAAAPTRVRDLGPSRESWELKKAVKDKSTSVVTKDTRTAQPPPVVKRPLDPLNGYLTQPPRKDDNEQPEASSAMRRPESKSGKTLRMNASAPKKKTLLCQEQASKKPSRVHSANTEHAIDTLLDLTSQEDSPERPKAKSQRLQFQERLAKIGRKGGDVGSKGTEDRESTGSGFRRIDKPRPPTPDVDAAEQVARLDELIMPPARPPSPSPEAPIAPPAPQSVERHLRRALSETNKPLTSAVKRKPSNPVRLTSPTAKKCMPAQTRKESTTEDQPQAKAASALPPKTRAKSALQRSVSLNTTSNGTSTVILGRPFQAPNAPAMKPAVPEKAPDPWSREAFDLLTWRPPGWNEEQWCIEPNDSIA